MAAESWELRHRPHRQKRGGWSHCCALTRGFCLHWHGTTGLWQTHAVERPSLQIINRMSHYLHCLSMQPSFTQISANHHPKHWAFTDWNWNLMERYQEAWKYLIYPSNVHLFWSSYMTLLCIGLGGMIYCVATIDVITGVYIYIYIFEVNCMMLFFIFILARQKKCFHSNKMNLLINAEVCRTKSLKWYNRVDAWENLHDCVKVNIQ